MQLALGEVIGAYAIAVLDRENPDEIIAAAKAVRWWWGIGGMNSSCIRCHPIDGIYGQGGLSGR